MNLLERLLRWRRQDEQSADDRSVQYEIQRMTHRGGWINPYPDTVILEEKSRPESDDNHWLVPPGRYRHIRRVDGRIDEVLWTYETEDADARYEKERKKEERKQERERQRDRLEEMSLEEVRDEFYGASSQLDLLEHDKIRDRYETLNEQQGHEQDTETEDRSPEERRRAKLARAQLQSLQDKLDEMDDDIFG